MQAIQGAAQLTVSDYWGIAVRRKWLIVAAIVVSLGISLTLCLVLPKSYRSSALILVENQKIPEEYVKATVGGSIGERLTMIQQQVMSRTLLSRVIEEFKLYEDKVREDGLETVIEDMRKNIKVQTVGTAGAGGKSVEAFSISFAHENPLTAMKVTAKLSSQFIEENLKTREQLVEGASEFIEQELRMAKERLEQQERVIQEFKTKYIGELPQQTDANLHALDRLQTDLIAVTENINRLTDRQNMNQGSIHEYQASGSTTAGLATGQGGQPAIDPLDTRLKELERKLATLSSEYKDTYPDIVQTKQEMKEVMAQLAEKHGVTKKKTDSGASKPFDPYLQNLINDGKEIKIELTGLKERQRQLTAQMKEYEKRVERAPTREQELTILLRDYDNTQKNYQTLLEKKLNARVAENLEKRQKGEQFRIIDPANVPQNPDSPKPLRIMLIGLVLGCGVGYGGAFALERVNASFRRPEDAEETLGCPILAEIPSFNYAYDNPAKGLLLGSSVEDGPAEIRLLEDSQASKDGVSASGGLSKWERFQNRFQRSPQTTSRWRTSPTAMAPEQNLVSKWNPTSVVAEQFRVAATRLALMEGERTSTVIVVTSAVKGEGKSSTVLNLGYVLANDLGKSTLIIDGDLKQPVMHAYSGVPRVPGLAEFLHGDQPLDRCLRHLGESSLWLVPAGSVESRHVDLAKMQQITALLRELRLRFEYILVDAPPILPLADINVLAGLADVLVMVVRAGVTGRDVVEKALRQLKPTTQPKIILTGAWVDSMPYYLQGYGYAGADKGRQL